LKIYRSLSEFTRLDCGVVTTGTFDGVHIGHHQIILRMRDYAAQINGETVVLTFYPHPRIVLYPEDNNIRLINSLDEKVQLIGQKGIDHLIIAQFTKEFSRMTSSAFVRDILHNTIGTRKLVIGYDHHFGRNREGSMEDLKEFAPLYGFDVDEVQQLSVNDVPVSSTKIRKALEAGDLSTAEAFLGYPYFLNGTVVEGDKLGREIGFPTANIDLNDNMKLIPGVGVYAVKVYVADKIRDGMLYIGNRPTMTGSGMRIEVNIFDFEENIYGLAIQITFISRLRGDMIFDSLDALSTQLHIDKTHALTAIKVRL
jgi:riboflavin kinase / FMN adenylyltransferase